MRERERERERERDRERQRDRGCTWLSESHGLRKTASARSRKEKIAMIGEVDWVDQQGKQASDCPMSAVWEHLGKVQRKAASHLCRGALGGIVHKHVGLGNDCQSEPG